MIEGTGGLEEEVIVQRVFPWFQLASVSFLCGNLRELVFSLQCLLKHAAHPEGYNQWAGAKFSSIQPL